MAPLEAIRYTRGHLELIDQRKLPLETIWLPVNTPEDAYTAIKDMVVRGAPAIGVTAALATAVDLTTQQSSHAFQTAEEAAAYVKGKLDYLITSRPTAVNLADACTKLARLASLESQKEGATSDSVINALVAFSEQYFKDDIAANKALGDFGATALLSAVGAAGGSVDCGISILTHCNTGSLATAGWGTALGVIRSVHALGKLQHVYATETRPYNQGARLTAYELHSDGLPATLIADSAACALMGEGRVDAIVVGADRVAANGDTANKIGTFSLAVLAKYHGIPFFIAAPTTTLDADCPSGCDIPIEQRRPEELTHFREQRVVVDGIQVWNPSFDVSPAPLIHAIITEKGIIAKKKDGTFDVAAFLQAHVNTAVANGTSTSSGVKSSQDDKVLSRDTIRDYIIQRPHLLEKVGPAESAPSWDVREVGDGNINFVYIIEGPAGGVCIKQGLGFVRCVGESWPLTQDRIRFEAATMQEAARHCPEHVPAIYEFDADYSVISMRYIEPPHLILRRGLLEGDVYPLLAQHMGHYLAATLFHTSLFANKGKEFRERAREFCNPAMCQLTEDVVFTEPFFSVAHNRWTSPQLDADVSDLQSDADAKVAAMELKAKFCSHQECLLHGDLHLGSLMVTPASTFVIDAEFAFYGPIAFDVAKFVFDLLLSYFALEGHATAALPRMEQREWLLRCMSDTWNAFKDEFTSLWDSQSEAGELSPPPLFGADAANGTQARKIAQERFFQQLFEDSVGFGSIMMIRRLVGIAHVLEMDSIQDPDVRAGCERRALRFARHLLVNRHTLGSMEGIVEQAQAVYST